MVKIFGKGNGFGNPVYNEETITARRFGFVITATIHFDDYAEEPWSREDGHGPVSDWRNVETKRAGELVLCEDRGRARFYDFAAAVKRARAEGWDSEPYNTDGKQTKRQQAAKAARADFERMRAWCVDEWGYVGVAVTVERAGVNLVPKFAHAVWGIESDAGDYLREAANELAPEAIEAAREKIKELAA